MDNSRKEQVVKDISKKKEFASLDKNYILSELHKVLIQEPSLQQFLKQETISLRSDKYKLIIKKVRARLRRSSSLFSAKNTTINYQKTQKDIEDTTTLEQLQQVVKAILKKHNSTAERYNFYPQFYQILAAEFPGHQSILDLGAGLHPLSIMFRKDKKLKYYAYDINSAQESLLESFFNRFKTWNPQFQGKSGTCNLLEDTQVTNLPAADLCIILKVTDVLDRGKNHKATEKVLTSVKSQHFVISFPTITSSGKAMRFPKRRWIELLAERLGFNWKSVESDTELFYLLKKEQ